MRIVFLSYYPVRTCTSPDDWFSKVPFYHGYLEELSSYAEVHDVAVTGFSAKVEKKGVHYHFPNAKGPLLAMQLNSYVKKLTPDVVIVHGLLFPVQAIFLRLKLGAPVKIFVQHHAEQPLSGLRTLMQRLADRTITGYFFADHGLADQWVAKKLLDSSKIHVLPEGSSCFYPLNKPEARSITNVRQGTLFLWVGRLNRNKDPETLIKAFISFLKKGGRGSLYVIYSEADLETEVSEMIAQAGVSESIFLVGKVPHAELLFWYNSADFIVNTSYYEGCNIAVIEGMSCGCVPIVPNIPSFNLHTNGGTIGLRFQPGNEGSLLCALQHAANLNVADHSEKTRRYFNHNLSFYAIARKLYSVVRTDQ